jgi:hypothetical protein
MSMWNAVEDRIETGTKYGRIVRKLVFQDIYADRNSVLSKAPISQETIPYLKVWTIPYDEEQF